ncbi:DUF3822 family protein [Sphingobacterium hungaricum]|uniref:DUF3822 domain-containing protein n=1 Tax=Sphingobacterium hungaricum TaxID=2082723 RepID=A0A928V0P1_9SPHI|nr:DUF3822 family protein [Sphingobacterium hungaricum]MBE8714950.1 DUF3822 domain-containing protein [Sphingobacterium hungaricum]
MQYTSEKFQLHYLSSYSLLIKTDDVHDVLLVLNDENEVIHALVYEIENPIASATKLLSLPFSKVYISVAHESLVLIPSEVYSAEDETLYSAFLQQEAPISKYTTHLDQLSVVAIYQYDILKLNKWKTLFPNARFVPEFAVLLEQAQPKIPIRGQVLGLHFNENRMDLFLFIHGEFVLYTNFEVFNQADVAFYVLQVFQNFNITNKVDKLLLSGIAEDHDYISSLNNYADTVEYLRHRNPVHIDETTAENSILTYNILLDTPICAS